MNYFFIVKVESSSLITATQMFHITMKGWNERCENEKEIIRKCEQVRKLCEVRDRCDTSILNKEESYTIIEFLYTY